MATLVIVAGANPGAMACEKGNTTVLEIAESVTKKSSGHAFFLMIRSSIHNSQDEKTESVQLGGFHVSSNCMVRPCTHDQTQVHTGQS